MFEPFLRSALKSARSIVVIISTTHHSQFEIRPISKDLKVALEQRFELHGVPRSKRSIFLLHSQPWKALEALSPRPSRVLLTCHCPRITSSSTPGSDTQVASSLFVSTRLGRNHESTLVMHVDETNLVREMKRLWTTRRWIFSDLFSRVSKTSRAFLSRIMMFFNPCRESVFHFSFGLDSNVWAKYGRRGDYFATTTFNVCGFIIFRMSRGGQVALYLSIRR